MTSERCTKLWAVLRVLPSDYQEYGGTVERWQDPDKEYLDCSCGCRWWMPLHDEGPHGPRDFDWGVCANPQSPRAGLLTWEHQAGYGCFTPEDD